MSLYKDASLVMIPSAYKDGKLYSIRPTDGSGDFTFSRGSNLAATRVDVNGLIEKGRENRITYSNDFQNASWTLGGIQSITTGQSGYDGSSDASLVIPDAAFQGHQIGKGPETFTGLQTYSIYAKNGGYDLQLRATGIGSTNIWVSFDLTNGVVGTSGSGQIDSSITSVGAGWYRCSMTFTTTSSPYMGVYIVPDGASAGQGEAFSGDGTSGLYVQDAQVEVSLVATDYIETGASTAQAGILEDMPRLDYSGGASCPALLLEPQRTNIFSQSEYIHGWLNAGGTSSQNSPDSISPEGKYNAAVLDASSVRYQTFSISSSANSYSVYAKAKSGSILGLRIDTPTTKTTNFDLSNGTISSTGSGHTASIESVGNGWYRCSISFTDSIVNAVLQTTSSGSVYVWGAQLEAGSYPTSYIPTYGSSVTRSKDFANLIGSNFTDVFSGNGTIYANLELVNNNSNIGWWARLSTTGAYVNMIKAEFNGVSKKLQVEIRANNVTEVYFVDTNVSSLGFHKIAVSYDNGDIVIYMDGVKLATYLDKNMPDLNEIYIGNYTDGGNRFATKKEFLIFPTALTDSECIALTTL